MFIDFTTQSKSAAVAEFRRACKRPEVEVVTVIHKSRKGVELPLVNTFRRESTAAQGTHFYTVFRRNSN